MEAGHHVEAPGAPRRRCYSPAELAPKIRRIFDGLPGILCVAVTGSLFRPDDAAFVLVMSEESDFDQYNAAMRRLRSFARLFGVSTTGLSGGPAPWMHVIYGREGDEWTAVKRRMNALARSVDTNGVELF